MPSLLIAFLALGTYERSDDFNADAAAIMESAPPAATVHLMSGEKEARLRKMLPRVDDPDLEKVLNDPRLILYTDQEIPKAYQLWAGGLQGIHSPSYNISANGSEPFGNGNREFPWGTPAGTHRTKNVEAFRFLWLPLDEEGKPRPVVWFRKHLKGDSTDGYAWTFPVGAIVGEVLAMHAPDGYAYTFEMRIRSREYGYWDVNVLRPYPTASALAHRIKQLRPDWEDSPALVKAIEHLEEPLAMKPAHLADTQPAKRTFDTWMGIDSLPDLGDNKLVSQLLTQAEFHSMTGEVWRETSGVKTFAPTTTASFEIVPANYDAGFVAVDRTSCARCHDSVSKPVSDFNPGRDWYGHIRGSDGIFSFHPFSPDCVSHNGFGAGVRMRPEFEKTGVIAKYDPAKHSRAVYQSLDQLRN